MIRSDAIRLKYIYLYKSKAYKRNDTATIEVDTLEFSRLVFEGKNISFELRKSTAIWDITYLVGDGVITMDELEGFSEDLIDAVKLILGR